MPGLCCWPDLGGTCALFMVTRRNITDNCMANGGPLGPYRAAPAVQRLQLPQLCASAQNKTETRLYRENSKSKAYLKGLSIQLGGFNNVRRVMP